MILSKKRGLYCLPENWERMRRRLGRQGCRSRACSFFAAGEPQAGTACLRNRPVIVSRFPRTRSVARLRMPAFSPARTASWFAHQWAARRVWRSLKWCVSCCPPKEHENDEEAAEPKAGRESHDHLYRQ